MRDNKRGVIMKSLSSFENIYLFRSYVDMRKQINGLAEIIEQTMELNPFFPSIFVFTGKNRKTLRMIYWDKTGFAAWYKRLEEDRFKWPLHLVGKNISLSLEEIEWLLKGLDLSKMRPHQELKYSKIS